MADRLDESLAPHLRRADRLILDRFADAASHAHRGRIAVATQRLLDLHHGLIGPDGSGIVGDARARFYSDSWRHEPHDPAIHDPDRRLPIPEGAAAARTARVGGLDAHADLGLRLETARRALVVATGNPTAIDTWHQQQSTAIRAWARRTLSDSQMAIHGAVSVLRLKKE